MRYVILLLTVISFGAQAQIDVYDYEKLGSPYYNCNLSIRTKNETSKVLAIEHKLGLEYYTKEQTKGFIEAIDGILEVKVFENSTAKREAYAALPDGSILINGKKEVMIIYRRGGSGLNPYITVDTLKELKEMLKKAYEKL